MAPPMDRGRFENYEAIKRLKAHYFRFFDTTRGTVGSSFFIGNETF